MISPGRSLAWPILAAAVAAVLALGARAVALEGEELFVEGEVGGYLARDMDRDGIADLWVSYHSAGRRYLALFAGGAHYGRAPTTVVPIDPQAILFAVGDFARGANEAAGSALELVLISRSSAVIYPYAGAPSERRRLVRGELFFALASAKHLPVWLSRAPIDFDGDGREDFLFPERERLRVFLNPTGDDGRDVAWEREFAFPVGYYLLADGVQRRVRDSLLEFARSSESAAVGSLFNSSGANSYPVALDFDGDGRLDIIVKRAANRVEVYRQYKLGVFEEKASVSLKLPWLKGVAALHLRDVNGDGRLDAVATRLLLSELTTVVEVYLQAEATADDRGFARPRQELRISGLFRRPELTDVDGDGHLDLLAASYRVDLLAQLKTETVEEFEVTYQVFPGRAPSAEDGRPFARRPALREVFRLRTEGLEGRRERPSIYMGHDLTGDGRADVLFVDRGGRLRLFRAEREGWGLEEVTSASIRAGEPVEIVLEDLDRRPGREAVLRYERSIRVVRFAR